MMKTKKDKPLTIAQQDMLKTLRDHSPKDAYLPFTAGTLATCDALERRGLATGDLVLAKVSRTSQGNFMEYKRAFWLTDAGKAIDVK
jgi:hypothetical protein